MWETWVLSLGWEDPLEKGKAGYPMQYSGLENSIDCIVRGVAKSHILLRDFHFHFTFSPFSPYFPALTSLLGGWPGDEGLSLSMS